MNLSYRDASRTEGPGFFVDPDNQIYKLPEGQSHLQWLKNHEDIAKRYDPDLRPNDPNIFEMAFKKGWIRIRMEYDDINMSHLIASVSAISPSILQTLPEQIKDLISSASYLDFINMNTGNIETYDKEEFLKLIRRQRIASINDKLITSKLNPGLFNINLNDSKWFELIKKYTEDLKLWNKLTDLLQEYRYDLEEFFDTYSYQINRLFYEYYATEAGGHGDPRRGVRQKFSILQNDKIFDKLSIAISHAEEVRNRVWNERQLQEESLDARLEREKGEYESREASMKLSYREDQLDLGQAWISPDGRIYKFNRSDIHENWVNKNLDKIEPELAKLHKNYQNRGLEFNRFLIHSGWIRVRTDSVEFRDKSQLPTVLDYVSKNITMRDLNKQLNLTIGVEDITTTPKNLSRI